MIVTSMQAFFLMFFWIWQVQVGGGTPFRTKQITIKGERHKLNPEWRTELWQPVTVPCMSGNIKVRLFDSSHFYLSVCLPLSFVSWCLCISLSLLPSS